MQPDGFNIDEKLADLRCPFTWNIHVRHLIDDKALLSELHEARLKHAIDSQEYFPENVFICQLMRAHENAMDNELSIAMENINKTEESLAEIIQKGTLKNVENVLQHIFIGTKCHVLKELNQLVEVVELLEKIPAIDDRNNTQVAMLIGCQCSALLLYSINHSEGILLAKKAIKYEPSNGKWYFLLAQNYREARRKEFLPIQWPSEKEASAFEKAYELFPNVSFGVSLAQLYRESQKNTMADKIYKEVYALQPTSCSVRLQLALGFIRAKECILAKDCLDYVAERMPESRCYTHYMGIYHEKCNKDFKAALPYYKSTTEKFNWAAEWQHAVCRKKVEPGWDLLSHMFDLLKKYENFAHHIPQEINIKIGLHYLFEVQDILSACQYLSKAIEIQPSAKQLTKHCLLFRQFEQVNVYHVLTKEVQYALEIGGAMYDEDQIAVLKETLELCRKNCKDILPMSASSRVQPASLEFSNSLRNYDQGASSHQEINWRKEKSSSPVRAFSRDYPSRNYSDGQNSSPRFSGASREKDYTSWRSDRPTNQGNRDEYRSSKTLKDRKDSSASSDRARGRWDGPIASSQPPPNKNNVRETDASCRLVKTVKDLNL